LKLQEKHDEPILSGQAVASRSLEEDENIQVGFGAVEIAFGASVSQRAKNDEYRRRSYRVGRAGLL
jgi:hypothetical protein